MALKEEVTKTEESILTRVTGDEGELAAKGAKYLREVADYYETMDPDNDDCLLAIMVKGNLKDDEGPMVSVMQNGSGMVWPAFITSVKTHPMFIQAVIDFAADEVTHALMAKMEEMAVIHAAQSDGSTKH